MILTGMRMKDFSSLRWSVSPGVAIGKGDVPNLSYILGLSSRMLLERIRGLGKKPKADLHSYELQLTQQC